MRLRQTARKRSRWGAMDTWRNPVQHEPSSRKYNASSAKIMGISPNSDSSDKKRILVVDDHEDNVEVLRARLEARGYEVEGATNGQAALDTVGHWCPCLLLLDVMRPDMDGLEVVQRLKA